MTSGFIDLATYDEPEKYFYGGAAAITYFVKMVRKATWFSVVPVVLSRIGNSQFGTQFSVVISRAAPGSVSRSRPSRSPGRLRTSPWPAGSLLSWVSAGPVT